MSIPIRPATLQDAAGIADLLRATEQFSRLAAEPRDATVARVLPMLAACLAGTSHSVLVAAGNGAPAGYLAVHWLPYLFMAGPEGFISELFVHPAQRGTGIGSALLDAAVQQARQHGCSRLHLINMRDRESYRRGFYTRHGWDERPDAASFVLRL